MAEELSSAAKAAAADAYEEGLQPGDGLRSRQPNLLSPRITKGKGRQAALGRIRAAAESDADLAKLPALRDFLLRETEGERYHGATYERLRLHARFCRELPEGQRSINDVAQELIDAAPNDRRAHVEAECERFFEADVRVRTLFTALSDRGGEHG
jgi:hypothetical protein